MEQSFTITVIILLFGCINALTCIQTKNFEHANDKTFDNFDISFSDARMSKLRCATLCGIHQCIGYSVDNHLCKMLTKTRARSAQASEQRIHIINNSNSPAKFYMVGALLFIILSKSMWNREFFFSFYCYPSMMSHKPLCIDLICHG